MQLNQLLDLYANSSITQQVTDEINTNNKHIFIDQLKGSTPAFYISGLFKSKKINNPIQLVILDTEEEAIYFLNTLESLIPDKYVLFFPTLYKKLSKDATIDANYLMLRNQAYIKLSNINNNKLVIVTYPEALFEKVEKIQHIQQQQLNFKLNDHILISTIIQQLQQFNFEKAEFVYEPGQYAIRGGILDIFSFGQVNPYRIELWDDKIESMRIFDPISQTSIKTISLLQISSNIENRAIKSEKITFFELIPTNSIIWLKNVLSIKESFLHFKKIITSEKQTNNFHPTENLHNWISKLDINEIVDESIIHAHIEQFITIEFGNAAKLGNIAINGNSNIQPNFNRQFNLLIDNLKLYENKGYQIFIFAEQEKQLERIEQIFEDLQTNIHFNAINYAISEGFIDHNQKIICYTDHQIFERYHKFNIKQTFSKEKSITLKTLTELVPGDFIVHIDHGVGMFSGLEIIEINNKKNEVIRLIYKDNDILYVNINALHKISKFSSKDGNLPNIHKLGSDQWNTLKEKAKKRVKTIAFDLIKLYAERKAQKGFQFEPDNYLQNELEASFIFEETPDQLKAINDVKKDMEQIAPMDRLVCGDVGFGKTEVAIRAAFKAVANGKQVSILVPTTILALQHYKTFKERTKPFSLNIDYLNRFKSTKEKKETLQLLKDGKIDIIIGTHALISKEVIYKDIGLLIIDEEHKFGVGHKEKIKTLKTNIDCLTLTATPIPRTLQFSLMGARDLSIIQTPPPNRQPIQTEIISFDPLIIKEAIYKEIERGGQIFFVQNRIEGMVDMYNLIEKMCPELHIVMAHGQLEGHTLEKILLDFIERKYDILICTNIIESGVDISNVNTIFVNNAHQFGLSDLHQLRGRVGRSNKKAYCYFVCPSKKILTNEARKRLETLSKYSELGSGFQIAMRDLDMRGAGDILGAEQSGYINDLGFETYQNILNDAIKELKRTKFKELFKEEIESQDFFVNDCTIETDDEILIPNNYIENDGERMIFYTNLNKCTNETDIQKIKQQMIDRFGPYPPIIEKLFTLILCKKIAIELGFEKIIHKDTIGKFYFISNPDSTYYISPTFNNILQFINQRIYNIQLKQVGKNCLIIYHPLINIEAIYQFLINMKAQCIK